MSYDIAETKCSWCDRWIWLSLMAHEIRLGDPIHAECAKEFDAEHGPYCKCGHGHDTHQNDRDYCCVQGCKCRQYDHAHGEHPDDHDPTDKELTAYYGTQ